MINVSELLKGKIHPLIHGALISRIITSKNNGYFAAISAYQRSRKIDESEFDFDAYTNDYLQTLSNLTNSQWISLAEYKKNYKFCEMYFKGREKAIFLIRNDLNISKESFFNQLYSKVFNESDYLKDVELNEDKKNFIRGFCELRGSIDTNRPLIAMDYYYDSIFELGKARLLNEYFSVPYYIININFRDLQNDFVNNRNQRNTQLRLQLNWYVTNIGLINDYKAKIVEKIYNPHNINKRGHINYIYMPEIESRESNLFANRLSHFSSKIFGKELTNRDIKNLRAELGFDIESSGTETIARNREIIELVRRYTADVCAGCNNDFSISNRTFKHRRTGRPYFEIHHNISLSNNIELDHENNLVKLCPVCHTCLKSGVGMPDDQKRIINNILNSQPNVYDFASHFFNTNRSQELIELIYRNLR